jgi:NifU-like protein involved in Fe-S cluster formation
VGWCAPQQGACKLTLNVKNGIIEEAMVETLGCSGMTHSAAMAGEILTGKTILEALNTDLFATPSTLPCAKSSSSWFTAEPKPRFPKAACR